MISMVGEGTWCILFGGLVVNMHQKQYHFFCQTRPIISAKQSFSQKQSKFIFSDQIALVSLYAVVMHDVYAAIRKSFST